MPPESPGAGAPAFEITPEMVAVGAAIVLADPWCGSVIGETGAELLVQEILASALSIRSRKNTRSRRVSRA
jgi:hypothetical protein